MFESAMFSNIEATRSHSPLAHTTKKVPSQLVELSKELTTRLLNEITNTRIYIQDEDAINIPIESVLKPQEIFFINEMQTVAEMIEILTKNNATFVVVNGENGKAMRTVDVLDIVAFCNQGIEKETSRNNLFEIFNHLELLKYQLTKATVGEIMPRFNWYGRTISSKKSMRHLMLVMKKFPSLKRIPITKNRKVIGVATHEDVLSFLIENKSRFDEKMNRNLEELNLQSCIACIEASFEEKLSYAFKVMWEKQMNGELASCKGSSSLDLFFNWLHFVHSASSLLSYEPAHIDKNSKVKKAIEQMLRENLNQLFVMDIRTKKTVGLLTITDIMSFFLNNMNI